MLTFTLELDDPRLDAVIAVLRGTTIPTKPAKPAKVAKAEPAAAEPLPAPTPDPVVVSPTPAVVPPASTGDVTYADIKALVFKLAITNQVKLAEIAKHFNVPNFKVLPESDYKKAFAMLSEVVDSDSAQ